MSGLCIPMSNRLYALTIVSSSPTVETKYPRAQNVTPVKFRSLFETSCYRYCTFALDIAHYIQHRVLRRYADADVDVVSHQGPFYYLCLLVLRQFPEYFSKVLTQLSEYPLLAFLRYKYYVVFTVPSRVT